MSVVQTCAYRLQILCTQQEPTCLSAVTLNVCITNKRSQNLGDSGNFTRGSVFCHRMFSLLRVWRSVTAAPWECFSRRRGEDVTCHSCRVSRGRWYQSKATRLACIAELMRLARGAPSFRWWGKALASFDWRRIHARSAKGHNECSLDVGGPLQLQLISCH